MARARRAWARAEGRIAETRPTAPPRSRRSAAPGLEAGRVSRLPMRCWPLLVPPRLRSRRDRIPPGSLRDDVRRHRTGTWESRRHLRAAPRGEIQSACRAATVSTSGPSRAATSRPIHGSARNPRRTDATPCRASRRRRTGRRLRGPHRCRRGTAGSRR